jgi:hypothetical protein
MRECISQVECLMHFPDSLCWITKPPQRPSQIGEATYPNVLRPESTRVSLLRAVEGKTLFQVRTSSNELTKMKQRLSLGKVGSQQANKVLVAFGQEAMLLSYLTGCLILPSQEINHPESPQHREETSSVPDLLAERARPGVNLLHVWSCIALDGHKRWTKRGVQNQLVLDTFRSVWEGLEHLHPLGEMAYRFHIS